MSRRCLLALSLLFAALPCIAEEVPEDDGLLDADFLTPKERAERELRRKREAPPVLACTPGRLRAAVRRGETAALELTVANAGGRTLNWSVAKMPPWISVAERAGSLGFRERRALKITVGTASLPPGATRGEVVVEAPGAEGSPKRIPILVEVEAPEEPEAGPGREEPARSARGPAAPPRPERSTRAGRGRFGVRAGYLLPNAGPLRDYEPGPLVGPYLTLGRGEGSRLSWELGLDAYRLESNDVTWSGYSDVLVGRADVLYAFGNGDAKTRAYAACGLAGHCELVTSDRKGTQDRNYVGAIDLGAGVSFASGRLDLRLTHNVVLGSENVPALTSVTVATGF